MRMTKLVVSFNRHFFAIALLACGVSLLLIVVLEHPLLKALLGLAIGLAVYFMVASVVASYVLYDGSDLYRLTWWPLRCLKNAPEDGIVVHAGFDPASPVLRAKFPNMRFRILDFFDARRTTETSIQRAHRLYPPATPQERISAVSWPVDTASQDVVFALSAAHELRKAEERTAFFREARRALKGGGKVIVAEQLRNLVNFVCFGVAALHFLSRRSWLRSFASADLIVIDEFRITPFMRVFVLQPS